MSQDPAYENYWRRKQMLERHKPHFPRIRWWPTQGLSDLEQLYVDAVIHSKSILDYGAGDGRVQAKIVAAGFRGEYHTFDIGHESQYTYTDPTKIDRAYGAILCLDVIEHLPLRDGLELLQRLCELLSPGGTLIVQTPNARCIINPMAWDMTHTQIFNAPDLWAFLSCLGMNVHGYRVVFTAERISFRKRCRNFASRFVTTQVLGADDAANIALLARKSVAGGEK